MNSRTRRVSMFFRLTIVVLLMFPLLASSPITSPGDSADVIYVDASASGADDGTSWTNAYVYLQDALDWTESHGGSDFEIWVAAGVYYPDEDGDGDHINNVQSESFYISYDNLKLYGGFFGTETSRSQRDWENNPTILSGDIDKEDTNTDGNFIAEDWNDLSGNNAYNVVLIDGSINDDITLDTVIDGFIITAGRADVVSAGGAGILCFAGSPTPPAGVCSPTLRNLIIQGNRANLGGGIYLDANYDGESSPYLTSISFLGNYAAFDGGGMAVFTANNPAGESQAVLVNIILRDNYAGRDGGGMHIMAGQGGPLCSLLIMNAEFYNNDAAGNGGAFSSHASNLGLAFPYLRNVTMHGNHASGLGGAVESFSSATGTNNPEIYNSILWGNTADAFAGELYNNNAVPDILHSDIQGCGGSGSWVPACGNDSGGNIALDPQFVNPATPNLRLDLISPAIDAGDKTQLPFDATDLDLDGVLYEFMPLDLDLTPRVSNAELDMGAYELGYIGCGYDTIGMYSPPQKTWYLKDDNNDGWGNVQTVRFGSTDTSWKAVVGDWTGGDQDLIGMYQPAQKSWYLKEANDDGWGNVQTIRFGSTDTSRLPVVGDWDGDSIDTIGIYQPDQKSWYLKDANNDGWGNIQTVRFGSVDTSWVPVVGDWDGDGTDTIGMYSPSQKTWYLKDANNDGWGNITTVRFGSTDTSWVPVVGDWDGNGSDTIGMYRPDQKTWYLKDANDDGWGNVATVRFGSTDTSWAPVSGRW